MTAAKTPVRFSVTQYVFSHGRRPRGTGCFAFSLGRDYGLVDELAEDGEARVLFLTGRYADVKREAAAVARRRGFDFVVVCS